MTISPQSHVASSEPPDHHVSGGQVRPGSASSQPWQAAGRAGGPGLEGAWIEIFRTGDYGERGHWSAEDLDRLAASYDPRLQPAPVVLGHPADDAPAYGWVRRLRRAGQALWAQLEKVDPAFEALLRAGRFAQRSVSLYKHFPPTGGPYLRHLGFLGAATPAVKGLAPVRFADTATVSFALDEKTTPIVLSPVAPATGDSEDPMSEPQSKLDTFLAHLRSFFTSQANDASLAIPSDPALPEEKGGGVEGSVFSERLAALEQRLDTLASEKENAEKKLTEAEAERHRQQVAAFVDSLRRAGRFPPAFERWGVVEFMERLAAIETPPTETTVQPGGPCHREDEPPLSPLAWFHDFLSRLPAVIHFGEIAAVATAHASRATAPGSRLVSFTEPQRGMSVDPASIELAERAEALAAELGISYAEALRQLREEHRSTATIA